MSVLVVGSTALDSIKTPRRAHPKLLGGSASHAAVAASFCGPVQLVGVVGSDFPRRYLDLYQRHGIDLAGLQSEAGKTFHWSGEYEVNMNNRRTLATELGVFEHFRPSLPPTYQTTPYVLLANIAPALQHHVLDQMRRSKFVVADTMDLWLQLARPDLLRLLRRVDALVLNDGEARELVGADNVIAAAATIHRPVKKGEHGAVLSSPRGLFLCPAYPLRRVVDPTGAGDSFVGGLVGYLASAGGSLDHHLRRAMVFGSVVASFCCEGFGLSRTDRVTRAEINARVAELERLARF